MAAASHAVAQCFERTARSDRLGGIRAKCRGDGVAELLERAPEDLAARLEFSTEPEISETVVARHVETRDDLIEEGVELAPRIDGEAREPGIERDVRARVHHNIILGRTIPERPRRPPRARNARCARPAATR